MGEPTRVEWSAEDVAAQHAEQDRLLAMIDDEGLISARCWSEMTETLSRLRALPEGLAWSATKYLRDVAKRGDAMFTQEHVQQTLDDPEPAEEIGCPCGGSASLDGMFRIGGKHGRDVAMARCGTCGASIAVLSEMPPLPGTKPVEST